VPTFRTPAQSPLSWSTHLGACGSAPGRLARGTANTGTGVREPRPYSAGRAPTRADARSHPFLDARRLRPQSDVARSHLGRPEAPWCTTTDDPWRDGCKLDRSRRSNRYLDRPEPATLLRRAPRALQGAAKRVEPTDRLPREAPSKPRAGYRSVDPSHALRSNARAAAVPLRLKHLPALPRGAGRCPVGRGVEADEAARANR
jgi:hypothetical protein